MKYFKIWPKYVGYALFGFFGLYLFFIAVWSSFEADRWLPWLEKQLNKGLSGSLVVHIGELETYINGASLKNVVLSVPNATEISTASPKLDFRLDQIDFSFLSWRSLLFQSPLTITAYRHTLDGSLQWFGFGLDLSAENLPLSLVPLVRYYLPTAPVLQSLDLHFELRSHDGQGSFITSGFKLSPLGVPFQALPWQAPPNIGLNKISGRFALNQGKLSLVADLAGDFTGKLVGDGDLQSNFSESNFNFNLVGKFSPAIVDSSTDLVQLFIKPYLKKDELHINLNFSGLFQNLVTKNL